MMPSTSRAVSTGASEKTEVASAFFAALDRASLPYVIVGDSRDFNTTIEGDIDIVTNEKNLSTFVTALYSFTKEINGSVVQVIQHEQTARYCVLAWRDAKQELHFLHPDICSNYYRHGQLFLSAEELLAGRAMSEHGFQVPAPAKAFLYYLLKKIDKGQLDDRQFEYLKTEWTKDPEGAKGETLRFWSPPQAQLLSTAFEAGQRSKLEAALPELRKSLRASLRLSPRAKALEGFRKLKRSLQPTGLFVVFLGPDGSGKSTLLTAVQESLAPAFRRTKRYHLRPHLGGQDTSTQAVTDPHVLPPRGVISSLLKLGYWALDYGLGYVKVYEQLVKSTLVLFDRYYLDLLVDPRRYRYGASLSVARRLGWFIPKPDVVILCDAPAEILQGRKQEVSFAETQRQRETYLPLVKNLPNGFVVDASKPVREVIASTEDIILNFMAKRTAKRLEGEKFNV